MEKIETEEQYEDALQRSYDLMQMDLADDSELLIELDNLGKLIEAYELIHYPTP